MEDYESGLRDGLDIAEEIAAGAGSVEAVRRALERTRLRARSEHVRLLLGGDVGL